MGFPSQLSAGQLTQVRATSQKFKQYLLLCPNDIVWQTQPLAQVDGSTPYAEFDWDGTDQGDRADVQQGMTVIISTSTDYKATQVFRGRVRVVPDATTFYIDETSANLETTYYVTVLNDFDIHERLERRTVDNTAYKDWDLTFQTLPPLITGLQSVYVDTSGTATVNFVFTATAEATAAGASISTYSWDVDDGTINSGAGTASIDVDFPGAVTNEHRWVRLTVTDDNAVSQYFVFQVFTVDLADTSTTVIALSSDSVTISATLSEGYNATVRAWAGISTVLDRTACAIVSVDDYAGTATPITQNVAFVGRLRTENSTTSGNERHAVLQDTNFTLEGYATQLGRLHGPGLYLQTATAAADWGEITTLTIKRALVYMLSWHSTFLNVSGLTFPSDSDNYDWPELVIQEASLLEWVNQLMDSINGLLMFAADGQSTIQRDARIAGTAGLTTVLTLEVDSSGLFDLVNFSLTREYISTHSQAVIGAATYNTTSAATKVYQGRAPAQTYGPGWETALLNGQIMESDLSDADARTEVQSRVANYFATINPRPQITLELTPGFYWVVPTVHQLYAFDIEASDTTRGIAYTSSDKWLCTEITYTYDGNRGYYIPTATFELIVAGGNVGVWVDLVPPINSLELPSLPGISAGLEPLNPLINLPVDDGDITLPGIDAGITQPGPLVSNPSVNCEVLNVSMKTGSIVTTSQNTVFGEPYTVTVEGSGVVEAGSAGWVRLYPFDEDNLEGWVVVRGQWATAFGLYSAGSSPYEATTEHNYTGFDGLEKVLAYTRWSLSGTHTLEVTVTHDAGSDVDTTPILDESWVEISLPATRNGVTYVKLRGIAQAGVSVGILQIQLQGTGSNPPPGTTISSDDLDGDAFYYGYNVGNTALYPSSNGFQVDSARPSGIPTYQSSHVYQFTVTGTGSPLGFRFLDSDYSDNANRLLRVTCCGSGMQQA